MDGLTWAEVRATAERALQNRACAHLITTNTLMLLEAEHDPSLRQIIEEAALSIPESSGLRWVGRLLRRPFPAILPGIDVMLDLCRTFPQASVYLLGSAPGVAQIAAKALRERFLGLTIVGARDGYFSSQEEPRLIHEIRAAAPDFLFVGLGMPAQEKWIARHKAALNVPVVMGVGGSFDVLSGKLARAPQWMRACGVEWLYRFYQEPWRWRRMAKLPVFLWKVMRQRPTAKQKENRMHG